MLKKLAISKDQDSMQLREPGNFMMINKEIHLASLDVATLLGKRNRQNNGRSVETSIQMIVIILNQKIQNLQVTLGIMTILKYSSKAKKEL